MTDIPIRDLENKKNTTKIRDDITTILTELKTENEAALGMETLEHILYCSVSGHPTVVQLPEVTHSFPGTPSK